MKTDFSKEKSGFTLIELLVVVSIISILSSTIMVAVQDARNKANDKALYASAIQLRNALELYKEDHGGLYPGESESNFYVGYMKTSTGQINTSSLSLTFNYSAFVLMMKPYINDELLESPYPNAWFYYGHDPNWKCSNQSKTPRYTLIIQPKSSMGLPTSPYYSGRCLSSPE